MKNLENLNKNISRSNSINNEDNTLNITCGWPELVFENNKAIFFLRVDSYLLEVIKQLEDGSYTIHFFPKVELGKNVVCELLDNYEIENEKIIKCDNKITYRSWLSLYINVDRSGSFACGNKAVVDIYKIIEKRVRLLHEEGLGRRDNFVDFVYNLIVLTKVDKDLFRHYDYTNGISSVYDITTYTCPADENGNVIKYYPHTTYDFH